MKKETINAINESIEHWETDILQPLLEGDELVPDNSGSLLWTSTCLLVPIGRCACSLCNLFYWKENTCENCPLFKAGKGCCENNSTYDKFYKKPTIKNAKAMIKALKDLLKEVS
jgi:hypothetical protein